jgi:hypothetical protein
MIGTILTKAMRGRIALQKCLRAKSKITALLFAALGVRMSPGAASDNITGQT